MELERPTPDRLTLATFALATTIGGANFIAVRFSNRELEPVWGAALRFGTAAILFVAIALALRLPWPRGRELTLTATYGLMAFALSYALMYWALVQVTAGAATVVLAGVPLLTLLLAAAQGSERLTWRRASGGLLALAGIATMTFGGEGGTLPLGALAAMLGAALLIAQSIIVGKRISGGHPAMINAVGMSAAALVLFALSLLLDERWALPRDPEVVAAVVYLSTVGSVGLFVVVLLVVRRWTASATSYMFVLFPVVTLALGAVLADEEIRAWTAGGAVLVMAGVWFGALSPGARTDARSARPEENGSTEVGEHHEKVQEDATAPAP